MCSQYDDPTQYDPPIGRCQCQCRGCQDCEQYQPSPVVKRLLDAFPPVADPQTPRAEAIEALRSLVQRRGAHV